jgi:hypothetical protein
LEVARLLLQGRSPSYSAAAFQVDGLDGEFRTSERNPGSVALARHCGCSIAHRASQGSREWHRVYYWSRFHHRFVLGVRLFVFMHRMSAPTPDKSRACVKSADTKFGNDHIFDMANFDETSRWMGWSKIEFSHSLSLQATPINREQAPMNSDKSRVDRERARNGVQPAGPESLRGSAIADYIISPACLSSGRITHHQIRNQKLF